MVRSGSRQGLAVPGHEYPEVEAVIARNERFVTTEKFGRAVKYTPLVTSGPMPEERIRRIGENEALYRQVNEQVRASAAAAATGDG